MAGSDFRKSDLGESLIDYMNFDQRAWDFLLADMTMQSDVSGSGDTTQSWWNVEVDTGATADSHAQLRKVIYGVQSPIGTSFDKDHRVRIHPNFNNTTPNGVSYAVIGDLTDGFGIKWSGGDLLALTIVGGTEYTSVVTAGVGSSADCRLRFEAGMELEVTNLGTGDVGTVGTVPSGTTNEAFRMRVENNGDAATQTLRLAEVKWVQLP